MVYFRAIVIDCFIFFHNAVDTMNLLDVFLPLDAVLLGSFVLCWCLFYPRKSVCMIQRLFAFEPVGNIPYDATEEQLVHICEEVGPVVNFRYVL